MEGAGQGKAAMDKSESSDPGTKRGIKYEGGYGPPPMYTEEEELKHLKMQDEMVTGAGLKFLNNKMASQGKSGYVLVYTHHSAAFRTTQGLIFHGNFVAKSSDHDDPNAGNRLFFVACEVGPEAIHCYDLGPVDIDPAHSHHSCKLCDKFELGSPIVHPPGSEMDHSCILCDDFDLTCPIFHPPGYEIGHLLFPDEDLSAVINDAFDELHPYLNKG